MMRAFLAAISLSVAAVLLAASPASAHARYRHHPAHPMVRLLGYGFAHMLASADQHGLAHRAYRHRVVRVRQLAQPRMASAFMPFEPDAPFSFAFGAAQGAIDTGVAIVGVSTSIAVHAVASAAGGAAMGASVVVDRVREAARVAGVPESIALAVARFESHFNERERGRAGEIGDMQVLPRTARAMGCGNLGDLSCVRAAGMRYLALALQQPGSMCEKLSAYNHGVGYRSCTSYGRSIERLAGLR